ncbi:MAG TPA: hypothetical protein VF278_14190, partial [Pirellulales bacterium]
MTKRRVLVAWIGHSDLKAMAVAEGCALGAGILETLGGSPPAPGDSGPTKTLVSVEPFDEIRLLSNSPGPWNEAYRDWLGGDVTVIATELERPTDYAAIFRAANSALAMLMNDRADHPLDLCIHLSPGTPAMAAVWLLLGKTRYAATFYETYQGRAWKTEIPFDLTLDVLPELLRGPDARLAHLAAFAPHQIDGFGDIIGDSQAIRVAVGR